MKNINKGKEIQKHWKDVTIKKEIENRHKLKSRNSLNRDRLASVQAMGPKII